MANPFLVNGTTSPFSIYQTYSAATIAGLYGNFPLGTKGQMEDGRVFRWASNRGAAIAIGTLCTKAAETANHVSVAWDSGGEAGSKTVTVTLGATAATLDQYAGGFLFGIDGTGSGQYRRIKSHPAAASAATLEVTVYDPFTISFASADEISLIQNEYRGIITTPGDADVWISGVPQVAVPVGSTTEQFFWAQTWGIGMVLGDGSTFAAASQVQPAVAGAADAGQITLTAEGGTGTGAYDQVIGTIFHLGDAASDLDYRVVDFRIRA